MVVLFVARTFGAVSGMMLWIIGYSTLAENIEKRHMGMASGIVSGAVAAGILAGPAVSGFFVEKVGYWFAWSMCFGLVSSFHAPDQCRLGKVLKPSRFSDHRQCGPETSYG